MKRGRWKVENGYDGNAPRTRYVGRERGGQGKIRPALVDLRHAIEAMTLAHAELESALDSADERLRDRLVESAHAGVAYGVRRAQLVLTGRKPKRTKRKPTSAQRRLRGI